MYQILAMSLGVLIAVMITLNSRLTESLGSIPAALNIYVVGLSVASLVILLRREKIRSKGGEKIPWYLYTGGIVGVSLVLFNSICFGVIGASLTISLGVLGQTLGGQLVDLTGFLGMKRHLFNRGKLLGWFCILLGAVVMAGRGYGNWPYLVLALITGCLVTLASVLNAQMGRRIGCIGAARMNYLSGIIVLALAFLIFRRTFAPRPPLLSLSPLYLLGGGTLGVLITTGLNFVIPRIPALYSSLMIFLGQAVAGLVIDRIMTGVFSPAKALGALLIFLGLLSMGFVDRQVHLRKARTDLSASSPA